MHPASQCKDWGTRIMQAWMEQLRARVPASAMVGLSADGTAWQLYQRFGFKRVAPATHAMLLRL